MLRRLTLPVMAALLFLGPAAAAQPAPPEPYTAPSFTCEFHHFGEGEAPPLDDLPDDDPLCVEYDKEDITLSTGGAVEFLAAEPARVAAAIPKCQYWQVDHWSVQAAPDTTPFVRWDGSYWFDKGAGVGAVRMENLEMGGQPASPHELADAMEPLSPELAEGFREFGEESGGGGMTFSLGGGDPSCPVAGPGEPEADPDPEAEPPPSPDAPPAPLPVTGGMLGAAALLLLAGLGLRAR